MHPVRTNENVTQHRVEPLSRTAAVKMGCYLVVALREIYLLMIGDNTPVAEPVPSRL